MDDFVKPRRSASGGFKTFLYVDGAQVADSLSALEGGAVEEARSKSAEEADKGIGLGGELGVSGVKVEGSGSKNRKLTYEEEVVRKRTGYSTVSALLDKLRERGDLGSIKSYTPEVYEQIEEGELYGFKAEIRMHPFHRFVSLSRGWAEAGENFDMPEDEVRDFSKMVEKIERAFYGKKKARKAFAVFAEAEGSFPEYKLLLPIKTEQLLVTPDEFSGKATFVAQVVNKVGEGKKYLAARMVRNTPIVAPSEERMMIEMIPALQRLPGVEEEGLEISKDDVVLKKPAMVLKPLCIYKG